MIGKIIKYVQILKNYEKNKNSCVFLTNKKEGQQVHERSNSIFTTNVFDYTNMLDKAADASWMREATITNNLSRI